MKNILIPTDFSDNAWQATRYAIELFTSEKCIFHLLNVYTPAITSSRFMATTFDSSAFKDSAHMYSELGLSKVVKRVKNTYSNVHHSFNTISSFSLLVDEVNNVVENLAIDLIVTGTKGASDLEEVFLGSNTIRIIKAVKDCPVLAVPHDFNFVKPITIAFATGFNRFYSPSELQPLLDIAKAFAAILHIVHVQYEIKALTELQKFNLRMLRKSLKETKHTVHTITELNSVSKTLEVFAKEQDVNLLAMLNYRHSYMERMTREPVVKRVAFHTRIPLLVIPEIGMSISSRSKATKENVAPY